MSIEFDINGLSFIGAAKIAIDGRVLDEPVQVGHIFDVLMHRPKRIVEGEIVDDPIRTLAERDVGIEVLEIEAYGKKLEAASTGLGCRLIIALNDGEKLGIGWVLSTRPGGPADELARPLLPPWLKYPDIPRYSIGWRMGFGEAYLFECQLWYQGLTPAGQQRYQALYPAPEAWAGYYDPDEDEE